MKTNRYFQTFSLASLALLSLLVVSCASKDVAGSVYMEYFVSPSGSDTNDGTHDAPFQTISHAAQVAMPGETITVREGVYREWISPARGGESEDTRITYRAALGEDVRILGSEPATGWVQQTDGLWKLSLQKSFFGDFNPFNTLTRHPLPVDDGGDGWGWMKYGRWTHLGDVFIDGEGLTEKQTLEEVQSEPLTWHSTTDNATTSIWANFNGADPNQSSVEVNARQHVFFPEESGLGYITFKGFVVMNVANHWAPPVVYQPAAIGCNGGHHWIIEDNIVMYAKAAAISIGIPTGEADIQASGHHIVRNNVLMRCGQGGTTGQWWNSHSQIYGNHIEDINYRKEFGGWETAGIKHHSGDSLVIKNNFIRNIHTIDPSLGAAHGIWNDWRNTNWRVSNNIVLGSEAHSILVEANWKGPSLYENNIFVGGTIATYSSRGDAWVHNLFINTAERWNNQTHSGRPQIGNNRWMNNIFIGGGHDPDIVADSMVYDRNVFLDDAMPHPDETNAVISQTPTQVGIEETHELVRLVITVDESILNAGYPTVNSETLDLPFSFDATVTHDFLGKERQGENEIGPFSNLQPGQNEFVVYEYPPLYKKALSLIGEQR
ncbi:MAG: DUF1565 domain-containing protein [Saprospiraceae bacterium]|nr:DUF1565 domain-containing protein [Saprospiraceae bacterium]